MIQQLREIKVSRFILALITGLVLLFIAAPIIIVMVVSFSSTNLMHFPPPGLSLQWYQKYFGNPMWIKATYRSFVIAFMTVIVSLAIGFPAAIGIVRSKFMGKGLLRIVLLSPLVVPKIILAIGLYFLYVKVHLAGTTLGLVIGHTLLAIPFTILVLTAGLQGFDQRLEWAAKNLGATPLQTFRKVTVPILWPSVFSAMIFSFIASFDDIILSLFLSNMTSPTLPRQMWVNIHEYIEPTIAAVSTFLILISVTGMLLMAFVQRRAPKMK